MRARVRARAAATAIIEFAGARLQTVDAVIHYMDSLYPWFSALSYRSASSAVRAAARGLNRLAGDGEHIKRKVK